MFFLSKLLGQQVRDAEDKSAGSLLDLVVSAKLTYPRVTGLAIKRRGKTVFAPWETVSSFEESRILLRVPGGELSERPLAADELLLSATFLDKQLVDTEGRKVIRVNDIQLVRSTLHLLVVAVDISSNALLRRIGLAKVGERLTKGGRKPKPHLIDWRQVDLSESDSQSVRLTVPRTKLSLLHPADIADIAHELTPEERAAVFDALEDEVAGDVMAEMHPSYQASMILELPDVEAMELLDNMSPDDIADLLADLPGDHAERLIALMEKEDADDVIELLAYSEHSAGGIMTTDYAWVPPDSTADRALELVRAQAEDVETIYYIYVVDRSEHLKGVFSLRDLLTQPPARKVREFMTEHPISIGTDGSEEAITELIAKYNLLALPVIDDQGILHGIITIDDAIDLVLPLAWKKRLPRIFH